MWIARQIAVGYRGKLSTQLNAADVVAALGQRERRLPGAAADFEDIAPIGYARERLDVVIHHRRITRTDGVIERRYLIECCAQLIPEIIDTPVIALVIAGHKANTPPNNFPIAVGYALMIHVRRRAMAVDAAEPVTIE